MRNSRVSWGLQSTPYQLFNSDMAWATLHQEKLVLLRPQGEAAVWLWDIARTIAREALGRRRFAQDRDSHPKPEERAQFQVFQKLDPRPLGSLLARRWCCHPTVLVFLDRQVGVRKAELEEIGKRGWKELVEKTLQKAAIFTGEFWARDKKKVTKRIRALVSGLQFPRAGETRRGGAPAAGQTSLFFPLGKRRPCSLAADFAAQACKLGLQRLAQPLFGHGNGAPYGISSRWVFVGNR